MVPRMLPRLASAGCLIDIARIAADILLDVLAAPDPGTLIYDAFASVGS